MKENNLKKKLILMPLMAPIHFELLKNIFNNEGYHFKLLTNINHNIPEEGLKYVHNDTCYPALLVVGQIIDALKNEDYDLDNTYVIMSQTGGGCRASNYLSLIKRALKKAGYEKVKVVSITLAKLDNEYQLPITFKMLRKALMAVLYGDLLMLLDNQIKPYEINVGESNNKVHYWIDNLSKQFLNNEGYSNKDFKININNILKSFKEIKLNKTNKIKVGIVGEIYVKYSSLGNNNLEEFLYHEGCEIMVPGLLGFVLYGFQNGITDYKLYGGSYFSKLGRKIVRNYILRKEKLLLNTIKKYDFFAPHDFMHTYSLIKGVISPGVKMGEGWLLTAEMLELINEDFKNIICTQPFGCLPNHIVGKGMIRKIKELYPDSNIVPIDYDPGATKVNQENRIKLMLSVAKENLNKEVK